MQWVIYGLVTASVALAASPSALAAGGPIPNQPVRAAAPSISKCHVRAPSTHLAARGK
jgi:hypothetical protein